MTSLSLLKALTPPALWGLARRLRAPTISKPEWEYVPEGWGAAQRDEAIQGWNVASVVEAYRQDWPGFLRNIAGTGPLGVAPEAAAAGRDNPILHNIVTSFGYALLRAAGRKDAISLLDWGGGIGHYYLLARTLAPELRIEYHCKDVPLLIAEGRRWLPTVNFHADEVCLQRQYDLVLASGSLQFAEDWRATLAKLAAATGGFLYVTSLPMVERAQSFVFVQRPYRFGYETEYLGWCLKRSEFLAAAAKNHLTLLREFVVGHRPVIVGAPEQNEYRGFLFGSAKPQAA
jgi:putative methyltransferase (TIGR04325 family)